MKDSSFGRLIGVLVAPDETFRSIEARPTWAAPLLLLLLLFGAVGVIVQQKSDPEEMVRGSLSKMKVEISAAQMDKAIRDAENQTTAKKVARGIIGLAFWVLIYLAVAAVFWVALHLMESELTFKQSFATTLHASMPAALAALLQIPILLSRSSISFEEAASGSVLVSSLKALAPEDASTVLKALLGSCDLFSIWTVVLLILGYRAVAKVSTAVAAGTVILLWGIVVAGKLGFVALFIK